MAFKDDHRREARWASEERRDGCPKLLRSAAKVSTISYGVLGEHTGASYGVGVGGESFSGHGVSGETRSNLYNGIHGVNSATAKGGTAIAGFSANGNGVVGANDEAGYSGVLGESYAQDGTGATGIGNFGVGVHGHSAYGIGVY